MRVLLFDLDNTLYSRELGVVPRIDRRINEYMAERLGIAATEADEMRHRFWVEHGTTLRGLMARYRIDPDDYLRYVHDVDLSDLLRDDRELRETLGRLPGRKIVFSNSARTHAAGVLRLLGIGECFETVIALEDLDYVPKPLPEAYHAALARLGAEAPECLLVEDTLQNLVAARAVGMRTVWVGDTTQSHAAAEVVIARIHEIGLALARLR